jgi:cobyrinic acid a,c-diamide synthase
MVGLLPTVGRLAPKRLTLDYAEVEVTRGTPLGPAGTVVRGHEFHASRIDAVPEEVPRAYTIRMSRGGPPRQEGYLIGQTLMSYVHLHFGSNPAVAEHLVREASARSRACQGEPLTVNAAEEELGHG